MKVPRIHLYYTDEDKQLLAQAVEMSPYDSASALVRVLVRQYLNRRLAAEAKKKASCSD